MRALPGPDRLPYVALQDVVCLLNVPRSLLAVTCSGKGLVAGDLIIHHGLTGVHAATLRRHAASLVCKSWCLQPG